MVTVVISEDVKVSGSWGISVCGLCSEGWEGLQQWSQVAALIADEYGKNPEKIIHDVSVAKSIQHYEHFIELHCSGELCGVSVGSRAELSLAEFEALAAPARLRDRIREQRLQSNQSRKNKLGAVYFVQAVGTNFIKIGWTVKPVAVRISGLQTSSPHKLKLIHHIDGAKKCLESQMHERFRAHRENLEWFRREGELNEFLLQVDQLEMSA